ncbi:Hpt domain-containing protein [Sphingomonas cavernae]|uniref:Hpt domain-containing protein n=1 Tax=Sphingomonas cavernae TaxID=2320861 RepID=A0A418WLU5_9SPHN|nr:Hpt domain-containing protein [Sphingomonas cavernae]RJF90968.1 Hpt domain-containing protein [Sphingomonas cavernae]
MAYDPGALDTALAAAVGNDPSLIAELRRAFLESAERQRDLLSRARCDANWRAAAWRLKGIAASFGAVRLMDAAEQASCSVPGDPAVFRRIDAALASFDC